MDIAQRLGLIFDVPIDPDVTKSSSGQSKQALMFAHEHEPPGVIIYLGPQDLQDPIAARTVRKAAAGHFPLPKDKGQYYLVTVKTSTTTTTGFPVLLREGEPVSFIGHHHALSVAAGHGLISYDRPVDMRNPAGFLRSVFGDDSPIPGDGHHRFLVRVNDQPILLTGNDVITFCCDQWALQQGQQRGVWTNRFPIDTSQPSDRKALIDAIGTAKFNALHDGIPWTGLYHFVSLHSATGHERPALIPLGDAPASARMAIAYGAAPQPGEDPEGLLPL